jgi:putative spermidine/putrescine transport system permease protein
MKTLTRPSLSLPAWLQALPMGGVFMLFFAMPLLLIVAVSFWPQNEYTLEPGFTLDNYVTLFNGCGSTSELCVTLKTYLSTLKFCFLVWAITLVLGFTLAYFVAFHVPSVAAQTVLFTVMTIPFWTSNVIRMISWIPLLGRNGLVNQSLMGAGVINEPLEWLLYSDFSVTLAFVHLLTTFMMVPIFNSMM